MSGPRERAASDPGRRAAAAAITILILLAWAIYRPELDRPFDYVDFPENVLLLASEDSFAGRWRLLIDTYQQHGRWSPITLAMLALQWSWFEWWATGWYLFRFVLSSATLALAFLLFLKLRLGVVGSFTAASLLIFSPAAVMGWTRLSTAEPLGLMFIVVASHVAVRSTSTRRAWWLAALLVCVLWTKEIMAVAFVFPLVLALASSADGMLQPPRWNRGHVRLLLPVFGAAVLGALPVIASWRSAPRDAFALRYGSQAIDPAEIVGGSLAAWLPFAPVANGASSSIIVVVAACLALLIAGWRTAMQEPSGRRHVAVMLALALSVPVLGAATYAPWPFYLLVYALPFQLAGSLLPGQAASSLVRGSVVARVAAIACLTVVGTFSASQAASDARRTRALHEAVATSVERVAATTDIDTVLVEVASNQLDSRGNFGPRFALYARMTGQDWPHVRDVPCDPARENASRVLILSLSAMCPDTEPGAAAIVIRFSRFSWPRPWPIPDSVTIRLSAPT